jgi:hypothetical protein
MELRCGTPKGLKHMEEPKPHLDEAGKATDEVHDVRADYRLTVRNKLADGM